ncbi:hypothetical protein [Porphyromonas gingivicanis]|nr:hypothetical protein [Porphyromonas gingivicanis]
MNLWISKKRCYFAGRLEVSILIKAYRADDATLYIYDKIGVSL